MLTHIHTHRGRWMSKAQTSRWPSQSQRGRYPGGHKSHPLTISERSWTGGLRSSPSAFESLSACKMYSIVSMCTAALHRDIYRFQPLHTVVCKAHKFYTCLKLQELKKVPEWNRVLLKWWCYHHHSFWACIVKMMMLPSPSLFLRTDFSNYLTPSTRHIPVI